MPPQSPIYFQTASMAPSIPAQTESSTSPKRPTVLYRLKIGDLSEEGVKRFLSSADATSILNEATNAVFDNLYPAEPTANWPGTRSVTLILEEFTGVAYTNGTRLDNDHKEIHFSTKYISGVDKNLLKNELRGVLFHEMVHCWQHNGKGTAPSGLIEGVADWVRLKANLAPPHWKRSADGTWDAGYDKTAYFLDWLEQRHGNSTVAKINESLRDQTYREDHFWPALCGKTVQELWKEYGKSFKSNSDD